MSEHIRKAIEELEQKLQPIENQAQELKTAINSLAKCIELPPPYPETSESKGSSTQIRFDQFHGQPLATVMRAYLTMRRQANEGPAVVNDIYTALIDGGFAFETKSAENSKRGLRISLSKNPIFYKLPNGSWGLAEWYPKAKQQAQQRRPAPSDSSTIEDEAAAAIEGGLDE
jgi:Arc/MetJ-type ribon-helix-helix transcriptional regulator